MLAGIESEVAVNIYRTKNYIVVQELILDEDFDANSILISEDTYILRNKKRDKKFEQHFKDRKFVNGSRVHATIYKRQYIV